MPCCYCKTQFTIFKRKRSCISCHCLYCASCLGKNKKNFCSRCEIIFISTKRELMELKTKDLIFFLQSRKINIAGIVEKEELCNLIINHINSSAYYDTTTNSSTPSSTSTPNGDFDNYAHSFAQIKQSCQNIFTSLSDKITSDFQKTTCFNQAAGQNQQKDRVTTQQPRSRPRTSAEQFPGTSYAAAAAAAAAADDVGANRNEPRRSAESSFQERLPPDCECSDEEMEEICEKRQSIFDADSSQRLKKTKLSNSSSINNSSSFEEVQEVAGGKQQQQQQQQSDDDWLFIESQNADDKPPPLLQPPSSTTNLCRESSSSSSFRDPSSHQTANSSDLFQPSATGSNFPSGNQPPRRRCSDSSLLNMKKSNSININISSFNPNQHSSEVKKIRVSCKKCGKAKSKIKNEIMKLSEQLKTSNRSESEINAKIKEFMDYLESKSQPSEMTETDSSEVLSQPNARSISNDEIGDNVFDENEGINVYASISTETENISQQQQQQQQKPSCSSNLSPTQPPPKRFISLGDISSSAELEMMTVKQLKEILMLNRVDFKGCCEKNELKERVQRLWESHISAPPSDRLSSGDLCKICMDAPIECVFLECGHSLGCIQCCKVLSECPICRSYIVRVVRIFKS